MTMRSGLVARAAAMLALALALAACGVKGDPIRPGAEDPKPEKSTQN